jgi:hypothetical protein
LSQIKNRHGVTTITSQFISSEHLIRANDRAIPPDSPAPPATRENGTYIRWP